MRYAQEMADRMPATMTLPNEFLALFSWMETNSFLMRSAAYPRRPARPAWHGG